MMTPRELEAWSGKPDGEGRYESLAEQRPGERVRAVGILGGQCLARRLTNMGLFRGVTLEILSGGRRGPVIIRLGASRLALGRGMAAKILVEKAA